MIIKCVLCSSNMQLQEYYRSSRFRCHAYGSRACQYQETNILYDQKYSKCYNLNPALKYNNIYIYANEKESQLIEYVNDIEYRSYFNFASPILNIENYEPELIKHIEKLLKLKAFI